MCAFNKTDTAGSVAFLACMDESTAANAVAGAKKCSNSGGLDWDSVDACYKSSDADDLLEAASAVYNKQFSSSTYVPHVFVNDQEFAYPGTSPGYAVLKQALCEAGSSAAICKSMEMPKTDACLF